MNRKSTKRIPSGPTRTFAGRSPRANCRPRSWRRFPRANGALVPGGLEEREQRSDDHNGLKADRADDPFQQVGADVREFGLKPGFGVGQLDFQVRLDPGDIGPDVADIGFRGDFLSKDLRQGIGDTLGLFGRQFSALAERAPVSAYRRRRRSSVESPHPPS